MSYNARLSMILDTDMDTDCDDAGALAILNTYYKQGKVDILGVICDAPTLWGGSCIEAINRYYSNSHIPVGVVKSSDFAKEDYYRFTDYFRHVESLPTDVFYNEMLGRTIGKKAYDYPSAVDVYRKLLTESKDHSVSICCIGLLTALEQLLKSQPDKYNYLSGYELVKTKVAFITCMADMTFPKGNEAFNWKIDRIAAEYVTHNSPVPIYVSSEGAGVLTGNTLSVKLTSGHPLRKAYEKYLGGKCKKRPSWDQIALLYAMGQDDELFYEEGDYTVKYNSYDNSCIWTKEINGRKDKYIKLRVPCDKLTDYIENIMCL